MTYALADRISQWKDVRIVQILDEFQYMNQYVVSDDDPERLELLCHSYMGPAESKFSPQIVAGSYIGWLGAILNHMTGRYLEWHLERPAAFLFYSESGLADEAVALRDASVFVLDAKKLAAFEAVPTATGADRRKILGRP